MKKINLYILMLSGLTLVFSCNTRLKEKAMNAGDADFTRYVAIGNSLTAGYQDGALYLEGQQNSYPVMLANQFMFVGGGDFKVPYMNKGAGNNGAGLPRRILGYTIPCAGSTPSLSPIFDSAATAFNNVSANGPYNAVAVPGARAVDCNFTLYSDATAGNPFLARFCQTPGVSTITSEALRLNPTFFTFWLGNNDALLYSLGGAVTPSSPFSTARLSDPEAFRVNIQLCIDSLTKNGAKGAIANIPDITSIPYFTTIPWNGIVLTSKQAQDLDSIYLGTGITWVPGNNGFLISDSTATNYIRHATASDLILLSTPQDSITCGKWGTLKPLADAYVLDVTEITDIQNNVTVYNANIANIAAQKNLALVDMNRYMKTFKSGIIYNGVSMNATYISGGTFSLDGVHPNQRGYALVANEFIRSINQKYGSTLPLVDPTRYKGILFP